MSTRELPACSCKAVYSDDVGPTALSQLEAELGQGPGGPVEVAYRQDIRHVPQLKHFQHYLGHKNIMHTVRYTELSPERFKNFWED